MKKPVITQHKMLDNGDIFISWKKCEQAQRYVVKKSESENGKFVDVARVGADVFEAFDKSYDSQKMYWYRVFACRKVGLETEIKKSKLSAIYTLKKAKMDLYEVVTNADAVTKFSWQQLSNIDGYDVFKRNEHASKPVCIMSVDKDTTEFQDILNVSGTVNYYSIQAFSIISETKVYVAKSQEQISISVGKAKINQCKKTVFGKIKFELSIVAGASGYIIKEKSANGEFKEILRTAANTEIECEYKPESKSSLIFAIMSYKTVGGETIYGEISEEVIAK